MRDAVLPERDDPGLFGPDSVTWRVHDDPAMLLAGFRALLLQTLHPLVLAGFTANSGFRDDPWGRLQRTGTWISRVTYGDTADALAAGRTLRDVHRRLKPFVDPDTGRTRHVDDPDLLMWVHCTEVESFLTTYRRLGGSLAAGEGDRYVDEMRSSAEMVGLDRATAPASEAELAAYYGTVRPQLRVTAETRRLALWGFVPPMPLWVRLATPARPAFAGLVAVAAGLLPAWARRMYGLPGWPTTDIAASLSGRAIRQAMLAVPARFNAPRTRRRERMAA